MTNRHCFVTDVGDAIERLADALDPQRTKPFSGDILDLLEWAERDVLAMRQQLTALTMQCEKLVKWKHLMSYNDSFFGEHAGDLKRVVYEIDRSMPIRGDK